ncbi:MAG: hypothetical protein IT548_02930 [Alphaproteobacteria bacterium]|nr:hypothetical protein [Alphaproteobacteria bacterium]
MTLTKGRMRPLLLSVSFLALAAGIPGLALTAAAGPTPAGALSLAPLADGPSLVEPVAARQGSKTKQGKASGAELLRKTQTSLSVVATTTKRLSRADRSKAAPFVQAIATTDRQMKALKAAIASKDKKALAKAVSATSRVVGKLNATFEMSKIQDRKVHEGMRSFNAAWTQTLKRLGGAKALVTAESTRANARRINAVRTRIEGRRAQTQRREDLEQLALILALLDEALLLNRSADYQWMALARLDQAFGYYGGYYDYYAVYDPTYVVQFQDDYYYWNNVSNLCEVQYETYYEAYSFESYEIVESYEYTESVEISQEIVTEEVMVEAEQTIDTVESEAVATGEETDGYAEAAAAESQVEAASEAEAQAEPIADPAEVADEEVDAVAEQPVSDDEAEAIADESAVDDAVDEPDAGAEEPAIDDGQQGEPEPEAQPEEPAAEPEAQPEEPAAEPEPQPEEEVAPEPEPEPEATEPEPEPQAAEPEPEPQPEAYEPESEPEAAEPPPPEPEPEASEPEPEPEPEPAQDDGGGDGG